MPHGIAPPVRGSVTDMPEEIAIDQGDDVEKIATTALEITAFRGDNDLKSNIQVCKLPPTIMDALLIESTPGDEKKNSDALMRQQGR